MSFTLPNPTVPSNGQALDATPILANFVAIAQAIASFDGSQIQSASIVATAFNANINPNTLLNETSFPFITSGLVWTADSAGASLNGSMTSGILYYNGTRVSVNSIVAHAFTASKDTYIDIDINGNVTYQEVTNNAASPALTANSIRVAIVVTGATIAAATSINQGQETIVLPIASSVPYSVQDSLGNLICPRDPGSKRTIGYRQQIINATNANNTDTLIPALSCPVIVPARRKVRVTAFSGQSSNSSTGINVLTIYDTTAGAIGSGATLLQQSNSGGVASSQGLNACDRELTPLVTSNTYQAAIRGTSGTTTFTGGATTPIWIKVELA